MRVVLFVSRNKDNEGVKGYKQRKMAFTSNKTEDELLNKFYEFGQRGVKGETSRFYISVNVRNGEKVRKALLHHLIDYPNTDLTKMESKIASLAARDENREEKRFLLDIDTDNHHLMMEIQNYLTEISAPKLDTYKTPGGWHIITSGFDTRELLEKFPCISLHRDGERFVVTFTKKY